ncbi:glycoside hydrolase family protein [Anopheles sinensis]|uniref:Glycoside hydrolase family protein n=1 Tax=Anopheles sinensis TaxID=74873 RepID=A0A084WBX4_ANOSI|nr:glycoside hydrolase family protein [Anopheles sinensis]
MLLGPPHGVREVCNLSGLNFASPRASTPAKTDPTSSAYGQLDSLLITARHHQKGPTNTDARAREPPVSSSLAHGAPPGPSQSRRSVSTSEAFHTTRGRARDLSLFRIGRSTA